MRRGAPLAGGARRGRQRAVGAGPARRAARPRGAPRAAGGGAAGLLLPRPPSPRYPGRWRRARRRRRARCPPRPPSPPLSSSASAAAPPAPRLPGGRRAAVPTAASAGDAAGRPGLVSTGAELQGAAAEQGRAAAGPAGQAPRRLSAAAPRPPGARPALRIPVPCAGLSPGVRGAAGQSRRRLAGASAAAPVRAGSEPPPARQRSAVTPSLAVFPGRRREPQQGDKGRDGQDGDLLPWCVRFSLEEKCSVAACSQNQDFLESWRRGRRRVLPLCILRS